MLCNEASEKWLILDLLVCVKWANRLIIEHSLNGFIYWVNLPFYIHLTSVEDLLYLLQLSNLSWNLLNFHLLYRESKKQNQRDLIMPPLEQSLQLSLKRLPGSLCHFFYNFYIVFCHLVIKRINRNMYLHNTNCIFTQYYSINIL